MPRRASNTGLRTSPRKPISDTDAIRCVRTLTARAANSPPPMRDRSRARPDPSIAQPAAASAPQSVPDAQRQQAEQRCPATDVLAVFAVERARVASRVRRCGVGLLAVETAITLTAPAHRASVRLEAAAVAKGAACEHDHLLPVSVSAMTPAGSARGSGVAIRRDGYRSADGHDPHRDSGTARSAAVVALSLAGSGGPRHCLDPRRARGDDRGRDRLAVDRTRQRYRDLYKPDRHSGRVVRRRSLRGRAVLRPADRPFRAQEAVHDHAGRLHHGYRGHGIRVRALVLLSVPLFHRGGHRRRVRGDQLGDRRADPCAGARPRRPGHQRVLLGRLDHRLGGSICFSSTAIFATDLGWRLEFGVGVVLAFGILLVRRHVPESPRWLFIHGREEEAERIVDGIERDIESRRRATPRNAEEDDRSPSA